MTDENIFSNEEILESGETRKTENQELDDATNEPRSFVEKNGNYEQAEAIQNTLTTLIDNETVKTSQLEYEPGPVQQPPDWDHGPQKDEVNLEDENTVQGRQPKIRGDLSDLEPAGSDDDKVEATPINLPGPQAAAEILSSSSVSISQPEDNSLLGRQSSARDDLDQVTENEGSGKGDEATPINLPGPEMADTGLPTTAKDSLSDGKSEGTAKDPLTGKGGENQSGSTGGESSDSPVMEQSTEGNTPADAISDSKKIGRGLGTEVPPSEIDGNEPVYEVDPNASDLGKDINEGTNQAEGKTGDLDPQRIGDGQLPEELQVPFGKGKDGLLFPGGGKNIPGGGRDDIPGGSSTSGGGPPVGNYGPGSKGKGKGKGDAGQEQRQRDVNMAIHIDNAPMSDTSVPYMDSNGTVWVYDKETGFWSPKANTIDGDQPMPYTGSGKWGGGEHDPDEPVGGPDGDSGKVFPVYYGNKGAGGDRGGRTPGDKDGDDDSGKFLGDPDLGGGYWTNKDPGDLDYYTPDMLSDANASKKTGRG
ncbi:MAG: hypothetical protein ISR59_01725 [Anaerolineales bacterium]|uniref:Uncharacterized protein n=1 Tax=Candidatus Desulfolinea nitratireducens TaxID=2841698 RepID=A0A8J6NNE4_9CHLR|nr:hypothetical protein [Candidatus Desulfolinea nitratireducens]MBL6959798.1 hypothetical protein [Anaerolineales bacterium]